MSWAWARIYWSESHSIRAGSALLVKNVNRVWVSLSPTPLPSHALRPRHGTDSVPYSVRFLFIIWFLLRRSPRPPLSHLQCPIRRSAQPWAEAIKSSLSRIISLSFVPAMATNLLMISSSRCVCVSLSFNSVRKLEVYYFDHHSHLLFLVQMKKTRNTSPLCIRAELCFFC